MGESFLWNSNNQVQMTYDICDTPKTMQKHLEIFIEFIIKQFLYRFWRISTEASMEYCFYT